MLPSRRLNNTKSVKDRWDLINITEIGEAQAMVEMVRHDYIGILRTSTACHHRYYEIAHGPGVLEPTTQFRQRCGSPFEQPYD
jgi:hypothetical protein